MQFRSVFSLLGSPVRDRSRALKTADRTIGAARYGAVKLTALALIGAASAGVAAPAAAKTIPVLFERGEQINRFAMVSCPNKTKEETAALARREYIGRYHNGLNDTHQAIGDGSVSYLYSPDAIRRVLEFDPRAKFIILVRDPVEMMRSYHSRMLFQLDEDQLDFARAWELQEARAAGQ